MCRACYGVLRFIMESGAKGCEVIVSGKLRAQRAKAMKFKDGYMISSGQPVNDYIDGAVRHVMLRQGVLGIKARFSTGHRATLSPARSPLSMAYHDLTSGCTLPAVNYLAALEACRMISAACCVLVHAQCERCIAQRN